MVELHNLKIQLKSLKALLLEAKADDKTMEEIAEIVKQIKLLQALIAKRLRVVQKNQHLN